MIKNNKYTLKMTMHGRTLDQINKISKDLNINDQEDTLARCIDFACDLINKIKKGNQVLIKDRFGRESVLTLKKENRCPTL